jgi:hypothetical protein
MNGSGVVKQIAVICSLAAFFLVGASIECFAQQDPGTNAASAAKVTELENEITNAVKDVEAIVNQMVPAYKRQPHMHVSTYKGGWFHPGAQRPNYNADVRTTQEKGYDDKEYVSSDLNQGLAWIGNQLEFNANLKYFYTNRTFPKKKLTDAEMQRINDLYKTIGKSENELKAILHPEEMDETAGSGGADAPATTEKHYLLDRKKGMMLLACAVGVLVISFTIRKLVAR